MEDNRQPASQETIDNLKECVKMTIESSYHELYVDMVLMEALNQGMMDSLDKEYIGNVLRVHANVCYANLCLCVQFRASLKSDLGVEKQYNIRRSVVTTHEIYKYLFGFKGKTTPWKELEKSLLSKYPEQCKEIAKTEGLYHQKYALDADSVLRDVAKHYSDNPTEFFENMSLVSERSVTNRTVSAMRFLHPIHSLLVQELQKGLGALYVAAMLMAMPKQTFEAIGLDKQDKLEEFSRGLTKYSGIVNTVMSRLAAAKKIGEQYNMDMTQNAHWTDLTDDNVGLHILYIYLDSMTTFRAFFRSESFAEYRQNLAYLIVSAHEGFKKLYGFDENKRTGSYWNRALKNAIVQSGDEQLLKEAEEIEARLDALSKSAMLRDEDMIVAFTHVGTIKKQKQESSFAVLDYFRQPVKEEEMNDLTDFLVVMNDIMRLYNKVMEWEGRQMQQETEATFAGYLEKIDQFEQQIKEKVQDPEQLTLMEETMEKLRGVIEKFEEMMKG